MRTSVTACYVMPGLISRHDVHGSVWNGQTPGGGMLSSCCALTEISNFVNELHVMR
jgi:hypothetical protein